MTRKWLIAFVEALEVAPIASALIVGITFLAAHSVAVDGKIVASPVVAWALIASGLAGAVSSAYKFRRQL